MLRRLWLNILIGSLVLSLFGFAVTAGAATDKYKGQTLTILAWGWDEPQQAAAKQFEKEFGVTVRNEGQESATSGLAKLQAQKGKPTIDVWCTIPLTVDRARPDLLADIDPSFITDKEDLFPYTISKKYVSWYLYPFGINWRTDVISKPITKWEDLWDPSLKGKIGIPSMSLFQGYFLIVCAYLNGGSENNMDPGFQKLKQLLPNIEMIYDSDNIARHALAQGEIAVAVGGGDYYSSLLEKNIPAKMISPKPSPLMFDCMTVVKGGNEALAHEYINFMLHPAAQEMTVVPWKCVPVNKKVAPAPELKDMVPKMSDMVTFDPGVINRSLPDWTQRWNREIIIKK